MYYEVKTKVDNPNDNKSITIIDLIEAINFAELVAIIRKVYPEEFTLVSIKIVKCSQVIHNTDASRWYQAVESITTLNEITGKETKSKRMLLLQANSLDDARDLAYRHLGIGAELSELRERDLSEVIDYHWLKENDININLS